MTNLPFTMRYLRNLLGINEVDIESCSPLIGARVMTLLP